MVMLIMEDLKPLDIRGSRYAVVFDVRLNSYVGWAKKMSASISWSKLDVPAINKLSLYS